MPVAGSQHGNFFADRDDPGLVWYLPAFAPVDQTDVFEFAAVEGNVVDAAGNPLDTASVTLSVKAVDPPDVSSARQANADGRFQVVPAFSWRPSLLLPYKDAQNADQVASVAGQAKTQADGLIELSFTALVGGTVIQAYEELANIGGASVQLVYSYNAWEWFFKPTRRFPLEPLFRLPLKRPVEVGWRAPVLAPTDSPIRVVGPIVNPAPAPPEAPFVPIVPIFAREPGIPIRPLPMPLQGEWLTVTVDGSASIPFQTIYATAPYKPRYTITSHSGATRPIIDASDLKRFDTARSEFRELTSLGDVQAKYPSLKRLYLGQVSGTVIAVPMAYGIAHGSGGCAARLDAVVDLSPTSSGCRFQLTFGLAPAIDPVDLAQLAEDLKTIPEAAGTTLQLALPRGLDPRVTPTFSTDVTNLTYAESGQILLSFEVVDAGPTPALVNINLLLAQLISATTTPLFGTVGVRLDDVYVPPVEATVVLNLHTTGSTDDVAITTAADPSVTVATNRSPNDVRLIRMRTIVQGAATIQAVGALLPAGQAAELEVPVAADDAPVALQRTLDVPDPFPRAALGQFLGVHVETVQQAMHLLAVNATAIDFAAEGINELDITIALDALPTLIIPALTLSREHRIDSAGVLVPIEEALTDLTASLTITVHNVDESQGRQVELANDFAANPVFVITGAALGTVSLQPTGSTP
jgi:hypothetical protein